MKAPPRRRRISKKKQFGNKHRQELGVAKCLDCGFKNSDLEFLEEGQPAEYSIDVESKDDLNIRVIKSGSCEIKIPTFRISVDSTMNSEGFITNIEGIILRFKNVLFKINLSELQSVIMHTN